MGLGVGGVFDGGFKLSPHNGGLFLFGVFYTLSIEAGAGTVKYSTTFSLKTLRVHTPPSSAAIHGKTTKIAAKTLKTTNHTPPISNLNRTTNTQQTTT